MRELIESLAPDPFLERWPPTGPIVIFDLEFTAWEGSLQRRWSETWEHREIIQVGAVLADPNSGQVLAELDVMVRPAINPILSPYITALTGIHSEDVERRGVAFPDALNQLHRFTSPAVATLCNGLDGAILRENCVLNHAEYPFGPERIQNLRRLLSQATGRPMPELVSGQLPAMLGLNDTNSSHTALADAKAILTAAIWLHRQGNL